jgi:uncharacterized protein YeaO (DUF488 family)
MVIRASETGRRGPSASVQIALGAQLRGLAGQSDLALLYAARDKAHNNALVLSGQLVAAG